MYPAPNADNNIKSPFFINPFWTPSANAIGIVAAVVFAYLSIFISTWSVVKPNLLETESMILLFAWCGINNDILGILTNGKEEKLDNMFKIINDDGKVAIIFINQENQSLNTLKRLKTLKSNQKNNKVVKAPRIYMDIKDFGIGAQILHDLDIHKLRLISNWKKEKRVGMIGYGLEIIEYINY